jgi:hypothetical protein
MTIEPNTWIENAGFTETLYKENGKKRHNTAKWDLKYDGDQAHIDFGLNNNGKKEQVHMHLTNDDIMKLLEMNSVPIPLEKRLTNDFLKTNSRQQPSVPLFMTNQPTIRMRIPKPFNIENDESNIVFSPEKMKRCKKRTQKKRRNPKKKSKYATTLRRFLRKLI